MTQAQHDGGSYRPKELPGGLSEELDRLTAQLEASWPQEQQLLRWLGLRDGQRILEIGSGPGMVTSKLRSLLPNSRIDCVESDPTLAALATERHDSDEGIQVIEQDINSFEANTEGYDWVIARYLFQHLADPVASCKSILPLLKQGGQLAVIDIDAGLWGISHPFFPEVEPIYRKAAALQAGRGGNRIIGRQLWRLLSQAGYRDVQLESFVYHSDQAGLAAFEDQISPGRLYPAMEAGLVTPAEMALAEAAHERFLASPDAYVLMIGLLAHGMR